MFLCQCAVHDMLLDSVWRQTGVPCAFARGPYVTLRGSTPGKPSLTPAWKIIQRNFLVNGGNWPLDHDDGSRYIVDRHNVVVYGGTKNFHGYEKQFYGNLFIRPDIVRRRPTMPHRRPTMLPHASGPPSLRHHSANLRCAERYPGADPRPVADAGLWQRSLR